MIRSEIPNYKDYSFPIINYFLNTLYINGVIPDPEYFEFVHNVLIKSGLMFSEFRIRSSLDHNHVILYFEICYNTNASISFDWLNKTLFNKLCLVIDEEVLRSSSVPIVSK